MNRSQGSTARVERVASKEGNWSAALHRAQPRDDMRDAKSAHAPAPLRREGSTGFSVRGIPVAPNHRSDQIDIGSSGQPCPPPRLFTGLFVALIVPPIGPILNLIFITTMIGSWRSKYKGTMR